MHRTALALALLGLVSSTSAAFVSPGPVPAASGRARLSRCRLEVASLSLPIAAPPHPVADADGVCAMRR
jgi:hypothetical protein